MQKWIMCGLGMIVAGTAALGAVWQAALPKIGVTEASARTEVLRSIEGGYVNYGVAAGAFRAVTGAARAALAEATIAWARAYTSSPAFKKAYAEHRMTVKPQPPAFDGTPDEELAKQKAEQEENAAEMKKTIAAMPPDQRKMMEEAIKASADAMAQMDTPEMRKMQLDGIRMQRESQMASYEADLQKWEQDYPEKPEPLIARRLQAFLDASASVDFDAKVEPRDGKLRFVNPAYEGKDAYWKLSYRAGRETVAAARTAAQAWLDALR